VQGRGRRYYLPLVGLVVLTFVAFLLTAEVFGLGPGIAVLVVGDVITVVVAVVRGGG
jgi:hypothetical protein